jgi:predicted Zn-dependent protease
MLVVALATFTVSGCAIIGPSLERSSLKAEVRRTGDPATRETAGNHGDMLRAFGELARAAGLDPATVYVAGRQDANLNAASAGDRHFIVTAPVVATGDRCLWWGLIAHELGHDLLSHADVNVATATALGVVATGVGLVIPGGGYLVQGVGWLGLRGFSRSQETAADAKAVEILERAGKPRWALRYTLDYLREVYGDKSAALAWLSTHPVTTERLTTQPAYVAEDVARWCVAPEERARQVERIKAGLSGCRKESDGQASGGIC